MSDRVVALYRLWHEAHRALSTGTTLPAVCDDQLVHKTWAELLPGLMQQPGVQSAVLGSLTPHLRRALAEAYMRAHAARVVEKGTKDENQDVDGSPPSFQFPLREL